MSDGKGFRSVQGGYSYDHPSWPADFKFDIDDRRMGTICSGRPGSDAPMLPFEVMPSDRASTSEHAAEP